MPAVMEQINRMTTEEKLKTMDYIWSSLSVSDEVKFPVWHERELKATEERVAAGVERPIPWKTARAGRIASRKVYYRGPDFVHPSGIVYRNVEDYLKSFEHRV